MSKRLFVGGLPWAITDQDLADLFAKFGTVLSAKVIIDKMTGRSKGFGFVEIEEDDKAEEAIKALDQSKLSERTIAVNVARPMEERPASHSSHGPRSFGGGNRAEQIEEDETVLNRMARNGAAFFLKGIDLLVS